jgi:hypothetical protein
MNHTKISPIFLVLTLCFSLQTAVSFAVGSYIPNSIAGELEDLGFVEAERAKMTDEQRAQFDSDIAQLTKNFEKMQAENDNSLDLAPLQAGCCESKEISIEKIQKLSRDFLDSLSIEERNRLNKLIASLILLSSEQERQIIYATLKEKELINK